MEDNTSDGMCRCCATEGSFKDFQTTYHWMGVEEIYSDMLKDCFNISLTSSEAINNGGICEVCVTQLRNAFNFKRQVQLTEEQFKKKVRESMFKSGTIKLELSQDDVESDNVPSDNLSDADYEVPIKEEKLEDKPKKRQAKASTSKAKKPKTEGETSKRQKNITISEDKVDKLLQTQTSKKITKTRTYDKDVNKIISRKEVIKHRKNIIEIILNSNATPIRCKNDVGYSCMFCNDHYPIPADLKKHTLMNHDEEAIIKVVKDIRMYTVKLDITDLQCIICDVDKDTIEDLIQHLITIHDRTLHLDIKNHMVPFKFKDDELKCAVCSNTFTKFRNLTEHMNMHFRNYVCDVCGAGFVNRDILRSHLKIHIIGARDTKTVVVEDTNIIPKIEEDDNEDVIYEKGVELQMHRTNIHQIMMNSNATPIRCYKGIGYACSFCIKQFPDPGDLKKHTLDSHHEKCMFKFMNGTDLYKFYVKLDITMLKCSLCGIDIDNIDEIIIHLKEIHNKKMFTKIKNQILPFKFETETLQCFICKMLYHKFKSLLEHMHTHYRNYNCEECDAGFVNRMILAQHAKCHKLGSFKCDHCPKEFDTLRKKRSHEKCVHTHSVTLYKCGYCNKKFKDYRIKVKHIRQEHGVSDSGLKCRACDRIFTSQREYNVHIKRQHLMDKRFKCAECDMAFFTSSELSNHSVKHTGLRKFECEICHKAYGRRKTLREHLRIHTDDRRFKCEHCSQTFVQKCSWRGHMRAKHGQIV